MARVKVHFDATKASRDLFNTFQKVKINKQMNAEIGKFLSERIKAQAKAGKPLNNTGRFPSLASATKAQRERLAQFNKTGKPFRPGFSNLTLTGQLLDAIRYEIARGVVAVFVEDSQRRPYRTGPKSKQKSPPDNAELQGFLESLGFFIYTKRGIEKNKTIIKRINNIVKRTIRRALRVSQRLA